MGTITANTLIDSASATLQDPTNIQWSRAELFGFVNAGQRDLCLLKPNAYVVNGLQQLVAGTKQAIPADGNEFVRVVRNMGLSGSTPGRAPCRLALEQLDRQNPNWHAAPAGSVVLEYGFDPNDPKTFYVSPPQPATPAQVDLVYHANPPDLAAATDPIVLDDVFATALTHYVLYRAYLKEGEFANPAAAMAHRSEFMALLGMKNQGEQAQGGA